MVGDEDDEDVQNWMAVNESLLLPEELELVAGFDVGEIFQEESHRSAFNETKTEGPSDGRGDDEGTKKRARRKRKDDHLPRETERERLERRKKELEKEKEELLGEIYHRFKPFSWLVRERTDFVGTRLMGKKHSKVLESAVEEFKRKYWTDMSKWKALEEELKGLNEDIKPSTVLQMLLWTLLQDDSFYAKGQSSSFWQMICEVLQVSPDQENGLKTLREVARKLATELRAAQASLVKATETIEKSVPQAEVLKDSLMGILSTQQLSNFIAHTESSAKLCEARDELMKTISGVSLSQSLPAPAVNYMQCDQSWPSEQ